MTQRELIAARAALLRRLHAVDRMLSEDARLVAAAPDLLEACLAAVAATGGSEFWNGETHEFLKLCEAAIAKATT